MIWEDMLLTGETLENSSQLISPTQLKGERKESKQYNVLWFSSYFPLSLLTGLIKMVLEIE